MWKKNNKLCTNDVLNMLYKNYLEKKRIQKSWYNNKNEKTNI